MQKILLLDRSYTERGRRRMGFLLVKRTFDVLASFCMLLVLLPLGLLVALICALDTKSSPIFSQERMGRGDKPFRIYKFRTMSPRTPAARGHPPAGGCGELHFPHRPRAA